MPFPLSQAGTIRIAGDVLPAQALQRIAIGLRAETIERLEAHEDHIEFRTSQAGNIARPGGRLWLFSIYDIGRIDARRNDRGETVVRYRLSTAGTFRSVATLSLVLAMPGIVWPWPWLTIGTLCFATLFGGNYVEKALRIRPWLRKVAMARRPYMPRPLEIDQD